MTTCLDGSIPAEGLLRIREVQSQLAAARPRSPSQDWKDRAWKKLFVERERWLDGNPAVRHLEFPQLAGIVAKSIHHFAGERYDLVAYVVMPSHIHWLFQPLSGWSHTVPTGKSPREVILHSLNSFTAHECNLILNQFGAFWQAESYDHCVRDEGELERIVEYIEFNPVKAGLCQRPEDWRFSSAYGRVAV